MNALARLAAANPVPQHEIAGLADALPRMRALSNEPPAGLRSRRRVMLIAAACALAVAIAAPALAFHRPLFASIQAFMAGDAPQPAKERMTSIIKVKVRGGKLAALSMVLAAKSPEGTIQLYALRFTNGDVGSTIVNLSGDSSHVVVGATQGPPRPLGKGQALDIRLSSVAFPGRSPVYFDGVVAPGVASVDVIYANGRARSIAVGYGYFVGWIVPQANGLYGDGEVVARDRRGNVLGRLDFCQITQTGSDVQFRPHRVKMPASPTAACAVPFTPRSR